MFKRSFDGGETWTALAVLYSNSTKDDWAVIGNSAVVQDRSTGKILVPFCRNNLQVLLTESTDDGTPIVILLHVFIYRAKGASWSAPFNITNVVHPSWRWVGTGSLLVDQHGVIVAHTSTGPPASVQLESGRILVPAYHDEWPHWNDGDFSQGHVMYRCLHVLACRCCVILHKRRRRRNVGPRRQHHGFILPQ